MRNSRGFTLIELMVVIAIVGILAAIAIPLFTEQVAKSRRTEASQALGDLSLRQERYRTNNASYGTLAQLNLCGATATTCDTASGYYVLRVTAQSATGYTLTATPAGAQTGDRCGVYTYTVTAGGAPSKSAAGGASCL